MKWTITWHTLVYSRWVVCRLDVSALPDDEWFKAVHTDYRGFTIKPYVEEE